MPAWTIYIAHQTDVRNNNWGTSRKWKNFETNKKVRQDSPPEYTATIEYDSSVTFNDVIRFDRDGLTEWVGFVEDIAISWDQSARFLNLAGRDLTFLLWRKYVENFNNQIQGTEGFFGNVNAVELIKFLLRTPRSDLPEVENDSLGEISIYPYNKEGWGIDVSNFTGLTTGGHLQIGSDDRGYGDIGSTVLRRREMIWGNSGSPNEASDQHNEGQISGVVSCGWETHGSSPYINNYNTSSNPSKYIKSHINVNDTAIFTQNGLNGGDNATAINSCYLSILGASDGSWGWWNTSNCYVYIWVQSIGIWASVGNFGGRSAVSAIGNPANANWRTLNFNCIDILTNLSDVQAAQIKFVETGTLSTYIQYAFLSIGYKGLGNITAGEWVNIQFNPVECMGVYIESRENPDQMPVNYHITTKGPVETFTGYNRIDSDSYIVLNGGQDQITFNSWQTSNPTKSAYFYRQGISAGHTGPIGNFDESFAFNISSSQSCTISPPTGNNTPPAFVPFCLANQVADYYTIKSGSGNFTALEILNVNGNMSIQVVQRTGGTEVDFNGILTVPPSSSVYVQLNIPYYVHVTRTGSTLTYSVYIDINMDASSLVFTHTLTTSATYTYRYQAITYNHVSLYGTLMTDTMDIGAVGEQLYNYGFELGNFNGWNQSNCTIDSSQHHSGTYSCRMNVGTTSLLSPQLYPSGTYSIPVPEIESIGFWYLGGHSTNNLQYNIWFTDSSTSPLRNLQLAGSWTFVNATSDLTTYGAGKTFLAIVFGNPSTGTNAWIDDVTVIGADTNWDTAGGTATRTTNTSKKKQGTGCQQIHCTANGQSWYYENNLSSSISTIRADAWVRCPPPSTYTGNTDVKVNSGSGWNPSGSNHWNVYGAYPYIRDSSNEDDNHIYVLGSVSTPWNSDDYCTFDSISNAFSPSKDFYSVTVNSNCKLSVSARFKNNIGGTGSFINVQVRAYLWVQHMNNGAGAWVQVGDSGLFQQSSPYPWVNLFAPVDISSYLSSYWDWYNAKVKFSLYGSHSYSGDPTKCQFQIGQVKLHWDGIGSTGTVSLLKISNSSAGVDPASAYIAQVGVQPSFYATSNQNSMRFFIRGLNSASFVTNGEWGYGWTELAVPNGHLDSPDPWVKIGLYVKVASGGNGYIKLYNITNWDGVTLDANNLPADGAYLLCQFTGLSNNGNGQINIVDYEAEYSYDYGNSSTYDTFLDEIDVYAFNVDTVTSGTIFAGQGSDITLVTVTGNQYPDIIHSWCPQTMSNIKIIVDDEEDDHGWEITQIYVYKTDITKFKVVLDSCLDIPDEYKLSFNSGGYNDTVDTDIGLEVYHNSYGTGSTGPNYIGILLDADDDIMEWRVDITGGHYIPHVGDTIVLATHDGGAGSGSGNLASAAISVYSGGPYIYLDDANIDLSIFDPQELYWIGPTNIPKARLSDILWDIAVLVNDDYVPFEWWISYPSTDPRGLCIGDFHIGPRRGSDKSDSVLFSTEENMESVKYQQSSRDTYQRCQVIGTGEGKNQDNTSSFWQNDQDAMDEIQGFLEDIVTQKQVSGGRIANRYAKVQLKLDASPKRKNAITCVVGRDPYIQSSDGVSGHYDCGDDVGILDFLTGLGPDDPQGGVYRIWNTQVTGDDNGEHVTLTVQAPYLDINNIWKSIYKQLKTLGAVGVIAQDWAGDGTNTDQVSSEKLTDLFSVSAKNDVIDVGVGSTDPKWYGPNTVGSGADWKSDSGNLSIHGGNSSGGLVWVEARYSTQYDLSGNKLTSQTVDISMTQEPKFTTTFQIYQGYNNAHSEYDIWNVYDFVDFGMFDHDYFTGSDAYGNGAGFLIRVICEGAGIYNAYAIFCYEVGDYHMTTAQLQAVGKAKFICGLNPLKKYKAIIEVEDNSGNYGNPFPEVLVSITDTTITNPIPNTAVWTQFNTVAMQTASSFFNYFTVRPIYIFAFGYAPAGYRCQMFFYNIKCQINVITETTQ